MNTTPIAFADLHKVNVGSTAVYMDVVFPENQDWSEVQHYFSEEIGFSKGKNLIGCRRITGNVLGNDGRWDYLLEFDHPEIPLNPLARLKVGQDLKWTNDFIDNFAKDYDYV